MKLFVVKFIFRKIVSWRADVLQVRERLQISLLISKRIKQIN